jgi:hypothetical protein
VFRNDPLTRRVTLPGVSSARLTKFMWVASAILSGALIAVGGVFYLVLEHTGSWIAVISMVGLVIVVARNVVRRRRLG